MADGFAFPYMVQTYSTVLDSWYDGSTWQDIRDASVALRDTARRTAANTEKRIVYRVPGSTEYGRDSRESLHIVWQGKRVPDWLGQSVASN
ncbi:hypothetical protein SEA_ESTES_170 [Mycobacterium phage Estes]|uniref:Uncharacterized protein n=1 Tax=Mycobacterium phage Estes TaxID=2759459 RepID=A0A7G9A2L9_9CAUD|nr:hypothetical protein J4U03_gp105 [Mycobacterium phage Estes]QNL30858.1 hypothetical protein SEA_ESTES_170 [Mycobacterium phage Estes]